MQFLKSKVYWLLLWSIALIYYILSTSYSIGLDGDSITYFKMAEWMVNFIKQNNQRKYPTYFFHFPPLYPIFLSIAVLFKSKIYEIVRIFHGILLLVNVTILNKLLKRVTYRNDVSFIGTVLFIALLLQWHSLALSEELFFTFEMLFIYFLCTNKNLVRAAGLVKMTIIISLSLLTRYAGVVFLLCILLYYIRPINETINKREMSKIVFILIFSILPVVAYILYGKYVSSSVADRSFGLYYKGFCNFCILFLIEFIYAFLPVKTLVLKNAYGLASILTLIALPFTLLGVYGPIYMFLKENKYALNERIIKCIICCIGTYFIFIMFSRLFIDAFIPPNFRMFSPVVIMILVIWGISVNTMRKRFSKTWIGMYVLLVVIDGAALAVVKGYEGWGYTQKKWRNSPLIVYSKEIIPDSVVIYTNVPEFFYIYVPQKRVVLLPFKYNPYNLKPVIFWRDSILEIAEMVKEGRACIVYFKGYYKHSVNEEDIEKTCEITPVVQSPDGSIFCGLSKGK